MRTNIVLDDKVMVEATKITGKRTKREVIDIALREFVQNHTRKNLSDLVGTIEFFDGYDYKAMRSAR
jgi:Arc/MetJ family transcription regulator